MFCYGLALIAVASLVLRVRAFVPIDKRCAICVAMVDEIIFNLEQEMPQQDIAVGDQNHRTFAPYATSELRAIEIIDKACSNFHSYYESEDAVDLDTNESFVRYDKFNIDRGALTGNQLHLLTRRQKSSHVTHNMRMYCDTLVEDIYEDLTDSITNQHVDLYTEFCQEHPRCQGRRQVECCDAKELDRHERWKNRLDDIDRRLVGEYFDLTRQDKEKRPGKKGYNDKAQRLYRELLRREAIAAARANGGRPENVAQRIREEIKNRKSFTYRPKTDEEREREREEDRKRMEEMRAQREDQKAKEDGEL